MPLEQQIIELFILAIPIACIARTLIFEEVFKEPREWCRDRSEKCRRWSERKFFYVFTCEYCVSHYITIAFLFITRFKLIYDDWRGYLISFFSLVFLANVYLNVYGRLRVEIHKEKAELESIENENAAASSKKRAREKNSV